MRYTRSLFKLSGVREFLKDHVSDGASQDERASTNVSVWGEATDAEGHTVVSRMHGPEAGLEWTARAALTVVRKVLAGDAPSGFQTPAKAYGADLALETEGVTREDVA
jgi:short subunit dehydrogenase-like uncharacterized protein